jgi:cytochrome P450
MIRQWREAGRDRGDLLSMLLLATDEEGDGRRMTDEEARDSLVTLLLAGHDTSAAGLTWCLYVLTQYPEVAARVRAEVDAVAGDRPLTYADQERLPYTEQVVKETMRLYPPTIGTFAREAAEDVEVGGYLLRKGSLVHLLSVITQRDPRWFPEPERFDPERFAPGRAEKIPPFAYFPFGGGPRVCIGNTFAMTELVLVTATLAQMLDFRLAPGQGPVEPAVGMSLRPRGGLRLVAARRERVAA